MARYINADMVLSALTKLDADFTKCHNFGEAAGVLYAQSTIEKLLAESTCGVTGLECIYCNPCCEHRRKKEEANV